MKVHKQIKEYDKITIKDLREALHLIDKQPIEITHKTLIKRNKERYLCNQACNVTVEKIRYAWKNVTCKNCLKKGTQKINVKRIPLEIIRGFPPCKGHIINSFNNEARCDCK